MNREHVLASLCKNLNPLLFFTARPAIWYSGLTAISFGTALLIWYGYDRTLDASSVQTLYQAAHAPADAFEWLLHPIAPGPDWLAAGFLAALHAAIILFFIRISENIGISRQTVFLLFILLNFSPEYNSTRLSFDSYAMFVLLWLIGVWWFLRWYDKSLTIGFLGWAASAWFSALFSLTGILWALGFPLLFLLWPQRRYHGLRPRLRFGERERFLSAYYLTAAICILIVPYWRDSLIHLYQAAEEQMEQAISEISLFMSPSRGGVDLGLGGGFMIALLLTAVNALKTAGILIVFLLWLSWRVKTGTVLKNRVRLFFFFSLSFYWLIEAAAVLYQGQMPSDLRYLPVILLFLWLGSSGAYYSVQRIKSGKVRPEHLLIMVWLLASYALASIIQFGPSAIYEREAGQWAKQHTDGRIFSNSRIVLYYAGQSPLPDSNAMASFGDIALLEPPLGKNDVYIFAINRKRALPPELQDYDIIHTSKNLHGDTAYLLRARP